MASNSILGMFRTITEIERRFLVFISCFSILLQFPYLTGSLESDESMYIVVSQQMVNGYELYSEIHVGKNPGAMYVYSSLIALFGVNITLLRSMIMITNTLLVLTTYYLARHLSTKTHAKTHAMLSSFLVALYVSHPLFGAYWVRVDSFMALFAALAALYIIKAIKESRDVSFLLSGFMCGISFVFKQPGLMMLAAVHAPIFLMSLEDKNSFITSIRRSLLVILGFSVPFGLLLIKLKLSGSLDSMIFMTLTAQTSTRGLGGESVFAFPFFYYENGPEIMDVFSKMPIVFYLGSCAIISRFITISNFLRSKYDSGLKEIKNSIPRLVETNLASIVLLSWVAVYLAFIFSISSRPAYVIYTLLPMCILASSLILEFYEIVYDSSVNLSGNTDINNSPKTHDVFKLIIIFFIIFSLIPYPYPTNFVGKSSIYHDDDTLVEAGSYIRDTTSSNDKILTLCYYPQLYIISEREPSSNIYYSLMGARTSLPNVSEEVIINLEHNRPTYIVTVEQNERSQTLDGPGIWYSRTPDIVSYVHENYHVDKIFVNEPYSWPDGELYIWKINEQ